MAEILKKMWSGFPVSAKIALLTPIIMGACYLMLCVIASLLPSSCFVLFLENIKPILAAAITILLIAFFVIKDYLERGKNLTIIYNDIASDGTAIKKVDDNNEIVSCTIADFRLKGSIFDGKEYIFIAITLTTDFLNIIHFAILGKLKQLQKYNVKPIIYLTVINDDEEKRKKINTLFKGILNFYLKKPEIIEQHRLHNDTMNKLDKTTIQEVLDILPPDKKDKDKQNYLISLMMPFIENDIQQKKETLVICGDDMQQFWNWDKIVGKKPPFLFILPTLKGLQGENISPKSTDADNAFGVRFNLSDNKSGFTSIDSVTTLIDNATDKNSVLQVYTFFLFPLLEKQTAKPTNAQAKSFEFKFKTDDNSTEETTIYYNQWKDVVDILSEKDINVLKKYLKENIPSHLQKISNNLKSLTNKKIKKQ